LIVIAISSRVDQYLLFIQPFLFINSVLDKIRIIPFIKRIN